MDTRCQLDSIQEDLLQDQLIKSREGLFFLADRNLKFLKNRKKSYLKKIIKAHIDFRDVLLKNISKTKRFFLQRFFKVKWIADNSSKTLGICFAFNFFHENERFEHKHLVDIIKRIIPGVRVEGVYFCQYFQEQILFCYAEIEKIRGIHLSLKDTFKLKKVFRKELKDTIETVYPDLFIPANEEEIYKHIATLSNEISLLSSFPHVMISFVRQNYNVLCFNTVLVRVIKVDVDSFEKIAKTLPFKTRIYINKTELTADYHIKEICAFSAEIPSDYFIRKNYSIDYLKARKYLSITLEEHIGEFRDCNGGLLIKQCEQLNYIVKELSNKIYDFSIIEELFFSFVPSSTQTLISPKVALNLYHLFCKVKELDYHLLYKMEYIETKEALIIFIKTNNERVKSLLYSIVLDENFLAAYARKIIENQTYFCFLEINPSDLGLLLKLKKELCKFDKNLRKTAQDVLRIPLQESLPPVLHPHLLTDTNSLTICKALYEGLTRIDLKGRVKLAIAKKIEISPCKKSYLITLKPTRWSNGEPLLADHFVYAWKMAILHRSKCLRHHLFYAIKNAEKISKGLLSAENLGIKVQSNFKILIELEHPTDYFTQLLANPIYSPLYNFSDEEPQIFNGPFKLGSNRRNCEINLYKNAFYWDSKKVKLKKISFPLVKDVSKIIEMFYREELDWVGSPFSDFLQKDRQDQVFQQSKKVSVPFWLHCNTKNLKLSSTKIRKALSLAIDRSKIGIEVLLNQVPLSKIIPEPFSQIDLTVKSYKESLIQAQGLFQEGLKEIKYDFRNFFLELSYSKDTSFQKTLMCFLKKEWEKAFDIKIVLKEIEWDVHWNNLFNGEYEIGGACQFLNYSDICYFFESFLPTPINNSKWENKSFQKYMDLYKKTFSLQEKKAYLAKAEKILQDAMPVIPVYNRTHLYICRPNLKKLIPSELSYTDFKWAYFE